jgi:hypothetical protein
MAKPVLDRPGVVPLFVSTRIVSHSVIAVAVANRLGCPIKHPSPKTSSVLRSATTASFPCLDTTSDFDLAVCDVEDCISGIALRKKSCLPFGAWKWSGPCRWSPERLRDQIAARPFCPRSVEAALGTLRSGTSRDWITVNRGRVGARIEGMRYDPLLLGNTTL